MKKALQMTRDGFTLIELMIVVAIIGILATIAVPQYNKFVAKSKQVEAKIGLGSIYTAEKSFQTENSSFTSCLGSIGVARDGSKFYYTIGFGAGGPALNSCGPGLGGLSCGAYQWTSTINAAGTTVFANSATATCTDVVNATYFIASLADGGGAVPTQAAGLVPPTLTTLTNALFTVSAAGIVNSKSGKTDQWTIDSTNGLVNSTSGI